MVQHSVFLNKRTTAFVAAQRKIDESIAMTAGRILREMAERDTTSSLKMTNASGEPMVPQYERQ